IRQPDTLAIVDTVTGKVTREREIMDLVALAHVTAAHQEPGRPPEALVVHLHEEGGVLGVIDGEVERELKLPGPLWRYDPATLRFQALGAGHVLVSLRVDPVNREAVARKKTDPNDTDLFEVGQAGVTTVRVLRLPGQQGRSSTWHAAGGRIAVLRRSK